MIERVPIAGANIALFSSIAAIAISGLSARSAEAMANPNPLPQGLELFDSLPGYNIGITARAREILKDSAVLEVNYADDGSSDDIVYPYDLCSGNVVSFRGNSFVSLDAHCEVGITGNEGGNIDPNNFIGGQSGALNFITDNPFQTYIEDTKTTAGFEGAQIATVTGMDISTEGVDSALLSTNPLPSYENKTGVTATSFTEHTTLPYMESPRLVPGQEVALYSSPASNPQPVSEIGRYIGMAKQYYTDGDKLESNSDYAVVTYPKNYAQDAGYWGASGSKFAALATKNDSTTGLHDKVVFSSGGLSRRYALRDVGNPEAGNATKQYEEALIDHIEGQTGVKISNLKDAVVLLYSDPSVAKRTELADNFDDIITKYGG
jgi:hypothetical protein